jgi:hypothetical protein
METGTGGPTNSPRILLRPRGESQTTFAYPRPDGMDIPHAELSGERSILNTRLFRPSAMYNFPVVL